MGGEGSIMAMIISEKNKRNLLKNRRKFWNKDRRGEMNTDYHEKFSDKPVTNAKLMVIRSRMQAERRREMTRIIPALITLTGLGIIFLLIIIQRLSHIYL